MFKYLFFSTIFSFIVLAFTGCQENVVKPEESYIQKSNSNNLNLPNGLIPDTFVRGYITLEYSPVNNCAVKLYKGSNYLTQTTTDVNGYYEICICCLGQGYGDYTVKAVKYIHGNEYSDNENFTWIYGTWDYAIDLQLIRTDQK